MRLSQIAMWHQGSSALGRCFLSGPMLRCKSTTTKGSQCGLYSLALQEALCVDLFGHLTLFCRSQPLGVQAGFPQSHTSVCVAHRTEVGETVTAGGFPHVPQCLSIHYSADKLVDSRVLGRVSYIGLLHFYLIRHLKMSQFSGKTK